MDIGGVGSHKVQVVEVVVILVGAAHTDDDEEEERGYRQRHGREDTRESTDFSHNAGVWLLIRRWDNERLDPEYLSEC